MDASALGKYSRKNAPEKGYVALLVGQYGSKEYFDKSIQEESLQELIQLSETAGITRTFELFIRLVKPEPATFLRKGTIDSIKDLIDRNHINLLIVDCNLKPGQLRQLEEILEMRVIGRVELILDIFAMRAKTKSSALQVELAQLTYILPRLKGLGGVLSRLGGGIGTRGPGETMLETDRRHIRKRILKIKAQLEKHSSHLANVRKNRQEKVFALVGYTNAGKTSLLNRLADPTKKLFAEDRLFATLDSFTRKVYLGELDYKPVYCLVTDTIGFIQNLPANLIAAFRSTLEEIIFTDSIIMVVDASSVKIKEEIEVVKNELARLGVEDTPLILYFNKDDLVFASDRESLEEEYPMAVWGNTMSKGGIEKLREKLLALCEK